MTRSEFLQQLKEALENDLNGSIVQENVDYYNQYIADEVRNGKTEAEVLQMLGDPWMIARTIIDSADAGDMNETVYESGQSNQREFREDRVKQSKVHVFGFDKWWKKLLLILGIIGIVMLLVAIISGIITIVAPILIPVCVVLIVIRLFTGQKQ